MQKDPLLLSLHCFCQCTALSPPLYLWKIAGFNQFLNFLKKKNPNVSDFGSEHTVAPACFPRQVCFLQVPLSGVAMEVWSCTCVHFHTLWRRGAGWRGAHLHLKQQALELATLDRAVKSGSSPKHNRCSVKTPTSIISCVQTHTPDNWHLCTKALHAIDPGLWCRQPLNTFEILRWEAKNRIGVNKPHTTIFSYVSLSEFLWFCLPYHWILIQQVESIMFSCLRYGKKKKKV